MRGQRYWRIGLLLAAAGCSRGPRAVPEVMAVETARLPDGPDAREWSSVPEHRAQLLAQDLVEPRLMEASTQEVAVRALTNGAEIVFRLEWPDEARDDTPGPSRMVDACAVQLPEKIEPDLPEPQMGQEGRMVQIAYWRADWQAWTDGRGDTIRDLYPNASVDHYPFEAKPLEPGSAARQQMERLYSPATVSGNRRAGPRKSPVESLIATGPGTLSPAPSQDATGRGVFQKGRWSVVIRRPLPQGLGRDQRTHVAFAVWQGSRHEAGARKMRTGWIPLVRRAGS